MLVGTASIAIGIQIFKTGEGRDPALAGSIPVRLRHYTSVFSLLTGRSTLHLRQQRGGKRPDHPLRPLC